MVLRLPAAGGKVVGSNPIAVMWDCSTLTGSCPELSVLWTHGKIGTKQTNFLHVFEDDALYN